MTTGALTPLETIAALALLVVVAGSLAAHRINRWLDRPLTATDRRLGAVDEELTRLEDERRLARYRAVAAEPLEWFDWPERAL
jgi:hypothetical protein